MAVASVAMRESVAVVAVVAEALVAATVAKLERVAAVA
jgi:hypothetical protein